MHVGDPESEYLLHTQRLLHMSSVTHHVLLHYGFLKGGKCVHGNYTTPKSKIPQIQWCKVTKYIYRNTVLKYISEVLFYATLYTYIHHISERNRVLFNPLHLSDNCIII